MPEEDSRFTADAWFVLSTSDPKRLQYRLEQVNMMREQEEGLPPAFRLFVPYTFLSPDRPGDDHPDDNFSLRSALHRYMFVKGDLHMLEHTLREFNRTSVTFAFFLRNTLSDSGRTYARLSESDMEKLAAACSNEQIRLDMPVSLADVKPGDTLTLTGTPFENDAANYKLISVKHKRGGEVELQVQLNIFNIQFQNLFVTYQSTADPTVNSNIIYTSQTRLLDIFKRRVNRKETDVTRYEDRRTLDAIFAKSDTVFPEGPMKRHFLALMLICAHLLGNEEAVSRFTAAVNAELADISRLRESKAATDVRAYLHIALYIATADPRYRTLAKAYVHKYQPQARYLCQFVSTASKRQSSKFIGPKSRT